MSVKDPRNTIKVNPRLARTVPSVIYFSLDIYRGPTLQNLLSNIKVDIWRPAVGLKCIIPPRQLSQLKTWAITLPSLIYFSWDIYRNPTLHNLFSNIKVDIWHPAVGLRYIIPPRHLRQLKTRVIPLIWTPSGQELCRPWYIFHGILIEIPSPQLFFQISKLIFDTLLWAGSPFSHVCTYVS